MVITFLHYLRPSHLPTLALPSAPRRGLESRHVVFHTMDNEKALILLPARVSIFVAMSLWLKHRRLRGLLRAGTTSSYTLSHFAPCQRVLQCTVIVLDGIRLVFLRSPGTSTAQGRGAVRNATTRRSLIKLSRKKLPGNNRVVIAVRWCRFVHADAVVHAPLLTRPPRLAPVNCVASLTPTTCDY